MSQKCWNICKLEILEIISNNIFLYKNLFVNELVTKILVNLKRII